jgi:hypothetical protein
MRNSVETISSKLFVGTIQTNFPSKLFATVALYLAGARSPSFPHHMYLTPQLPHFFIPTPQYLPLQITNVQRP